MAETGKNAWRRLYVFLAVALAVFLAALTGVGTLCHGFAIPPAGGSQPAAIQPLPIPPKVKTALAAAEEQGQDAYQAAQCAADEYQTTDIQLQDLLNAHFDELLHAAESADVQNTSPSTTADSPATPSLSSSSTQLSPPTPQLIINPRWLELRDQIDQMRSQRLKLSATLLPTHPTMQALEQSLSDLDQQLKSTPKEIPDPAIEDSTDSQSGPGLAQSQQNRPAARPSSVPAEPPAPNVLTTLRPRWQKTADEYRELTAQLQDEKNQCYEALNNQSAAWQRKAQIPADYIATLTMPRVPVKPLGADPRTAIYWCGLLAVVAAALIAGGARGSKAVFRTAAEVRQRLALTILGFLPPRLSLASRARPPGEPRWIGRTLLAAELYLLAVVVLLTVMAVLDHQFCGQFLANPLAACSQKFFC
jgi:hypothetical protein